MADASVWLPLGTACLGAVTALAGAALGPAFGARGEHRQWLRNKRAVLLEEFHVILDEAEDDTLAYDSPAHFNSAPRDLMALVAHSRAIFERLMAASSRAEIYVSQELSDLMSRCTFDYHVVYSASEVYGRQEWSTFRQDWIRDVEMCKALIRKELKVD
jgi:hypothetical protein